MTCEIRGLLYDEYKYYGLHELLGIVKIKSDVILQVLEGSSEETSFKYSSLLHLFFLLKGHDYLRK
jgi:hypothetical protein